jgi:hypothetical protein
MARYSVPADAPDTPLAPPAPPGGGVWRWNPDTGELTPATDPLPAELPPTTEETTDG